MRNFITCRLAMNKTENINKEYSRKEKKENGRKLQNNFHFLLFFYLLNKENTEIYVIRNMR